MGAVAVIELMELYEPFGEAGLVAVTCGSIQFCGIPGQERTLRHSRVSGVPEGRSGSAIRPIESLVEKTSLGLAAVWMQFWVRWIAKHVLSSIAGVVTAPMWPSNHVGGEKEYDAYTVAALLECPSPSRPL